MGINQTVIEAVLKQFGDVSVTVPESSKARVFASFQDSLVAETVADFLKQPIPEFQNRPVTVKYAAVMEPHTVILCALT